MRRDQDLPKDALTVPQQQQLVQLLVKDAIAETRAIFAGMMLFGLRRGEFTHARKTWLYGNSVIKLPNAQECTLSCSECKRAAQHSKARPKTEVPMWYPKTFNSVRRIPAYEIELAVSEWFFGESTSGACDVFADYVEHANHIKRVAIDRRVAEWGAKVGRPDLYPHALRATAAMNLLRMNYADKDIMRTMGWARQDELDVYIDYLAIKRERQLAYRSPL